MKALIIKENFFSSKLFVVYLLILCWAPLPLGSNRPWAWSLLCLLCFLLSIALLIEAMISHIDIASLLKKNRIFLGLFACVPLWATLQSLSFPEGFIQLLSPAAVELYAVTEYTEMSFSLESARTLQMAMLSWALWLFFIATLLLVDSSKRVKLLLSIIVMSGLFQALYAITMTLGGAEYEAILLQQTNVGNATGTFVNRNHLAGYLEMCLAAGVGLLVASLGKKIHKGWRGQARHWLDTFLGSKIRLRLYLAIMVIALVLTRSRMGNTAFFISLPLCGLLMMALQGRINRGALILFASLLFVDFFIVGQWFGFEEIAERVQNSNSAVETRDEVYRDTWRLIKEYPITGTGLGTFYSSFPQLRSSDITGFYRHTHNDYLEFASGLGLLGIVPLACSVLLTLALAIKALYKRNDDLMKGAAFASVMGIVSILIHSLVDFNLQIPANALLFVVLLAMAHIASGKFSNRLVRRQL